MRIYVQHYSYSIGTVGTGAVQPSPLLDSSWIKFIFLSNQPILMLMSSSFLNWIMLCTMFMPDATRIKERRILVTGVCCIIALFWLIPKHLSLHYLCLWIPGKGNHVSILMGTDNNSFIPSSSCNPESDFYSHLSCCSSLLMNPIPLVSSSVLLAVSTCE